MIYEYSGRVAFDSIFDFNDGHVEFYKLFFGVPIGESYEDKEVRLIFSEPKSNDPDLEKYRPQIEIELYNAPEKKYCGIINRDGIWKFYDGYVQINDEINSDLIGMKCMIQLLD